MCVCVRKTGVILSGGPSSVYEKDSPHVPEGLWDIGVPILGICYGLQEMAWSLGGEVLRSCMIPHPTQVCTQDLSTIGPAL